VLLKLTAYGVLSRGLLSGSVTPTRPAQRSDLRGHLPRFSGENLTRNLALANSLRSIATEKGVTASQLAIAWVLSRGQDIFPLIGARRRAQLAEALGATALSLSSADLERIEAAVPTSAVAGDRYPAAHMAHLESERQ